MRINDMDFTIGADPEVFVGRGGQFISAHGMVAGTKEEPTPVRNGAVQIDGMALEFNIDPAADYETFQLHLDDVKAQLKGMIDPSLDFLQAASVEFSAELFQQVPEYNRRLGCEPDFNAWDYCVNNAPDGTRLMRTAGGHVHIGGFFTEELMDDDHLDKVSRLTRLMDEEVGTYSVLWDKDDLRRGMYGKAGAFRPKKYGMEYRSMSNAWIFNKDLVKFVYEGTERAITRLLNGEDGDPVAREIIDNSIRDHPFFNNNSLAKMVS